MFKDRSKDPLILIVDDSVSNIRLLSEAVSEIGKVIFATDGQSAMKLVSEHAPDVVLLDIEMPGMDGYEVCKAIKTDTRNENTAVIFVTSHSDMDTELRALSLGAVDFLQKPIHAPVARARVFTHYQLQKRTRELATAKKDLDDMVRNLPAFVAYWDENLFNSFSNDASGYWFEVPSRSMRGMHLKDVIGTQNFDLLGAQIQLALNGESPTFEFPPIVKDGRFILGQASLVCRKVDGVVNGFLLLITDITPRKLAEQALHNEKERIRVTLNSIGDAVLATDCDGKVTFLNPIAEQMTGWSTEEANGLPVEVVMPLVDGHDGHAATNPIRLALREKRVVGMAINIALKRRDGKTFLVEDSAAPIKDHIGEVTGAIIVFHDVSEARAMAIKMTHLANYDALTNLPNRLLWHDRASQALQSARLKGSQVAMVLLDIDNFTFVNDTHGHSVGDQLLQQMASRLTNLLRETDTVSRHGGDEFIVLLPDLEDIQQVIDLASTVMAAVTQPFHVSNKRFDLSVSMGISLYPNDSLDQETLYRHADAAMYRAKQSGKNRFDFFSDEIEQQMLDRQSMEQDLRDALSRDEFLVFYQTKVDVETRAIVGMEALVRWRKSDGTLVSPANFIPVAEDTGLIIAIGKYVLHRACLDAKTWLDRGRPIKVSVNVSPVQFSQKDFVSSIEDALAISKLDPDLLELEITESVLAEDYAQVGSVLHSLRALGVGIAIDDFGTGYSSLSYLKHFPIDVLKIDQSFVRDMLTDKSDAAIITAIVHLAQSLGIQLVAEGVETEAQSHALRDCGCRIMQGYLFSKPESFEMVSRSFLAP